MQLPHDEQDSAGDELLITTEGARGSDSLGPSRSLPARAPARASHRPLGVIAATVAGLAAFALYALPPRATTNARSLLKQAIEQLGHDGLALRNVQCPHELTLTLDEPFMCSARADGVSLRVELTPIATRENGPIDSLRPHVDGAVGVADVARIAAERYAANASVTCPHRLWLAKPGSRALCTMRIGANQGPLTVSSHADGGPLTLDAQWVTAQR